MKNFCKGISILKECWVDINKLLEPLREIEQKKVEIKKNKNLIKYMSLEEKEEYFNLILFNS
jgi:hypothetical protein